MVALSIVLYLGAMVINDFVFIQFQEIPGVNWVFLPAGVCLVSGEFQVSPLLHYLLQHSICSRIRGFMPLD